VPVGSDGTHESTPAPGPRARWGTRIGLGLLAPVIVLAAGVALDRAAHGGAVARGVTLAGRPVGGLGPEALGREIAALDTALRARAIEVVVGDRRFPSSGEEPGLALDAEATAAAVLAAGREGSVVAQARWWLERWRGPWHVTPIAHLDPEAVTAVLARWEAEAVTQPPFDGAVHGLPDGGVRLDRPRPGWGIDRERAREALQAALLAGADLVALPLVERAPRVTEAAAHAAAERARRLLSGDVAVWHRPEETPLVPTVPRPKRRPRAHADDSAPRVPDVMRWSLGRSALARALVSRVGPGDMLELAFEVGALREALADVRAAIERPPRDARFLVDARDEVSVAPSAPAVTVDEPALARALLAAAERADREVELPLARGAEPALTTARALDLGIRGLVSRFTTRFRAREPRVRNIERIAAMVDGVVVPPGEILSLNALVGERTLARGFVPAPSIVDGEMEDTVGGGISQFATTLFNAAFHGGYEIVERKAHSFYFRRYPMGHEATLGYPKPDLVVRNDTAAGLLLKAVVGPTSVTVSFYGDNGGRSVRRKVSPIFDVVRAPVTIIADDSLAPDAQKVMEPGQAGWSVLVARVLSFPDGSTREEKRKVTYQPRPRLVRLHPCKIPAGAEGHTGEPCPDDDAHASAVAEPPAGTER
jgi:vancomycin resistance protein YoaR